MELLTFISDAERKKRLAEATGTSAAYLWQIATRWQRKGGKPKQASTDLAQAIERESALIGPDGVPKESLRPDVWPPADSAANAAHEPPQSEAKVA